MSAPLTDEQIAAMRAEGEMLRKRIAERVVPMKRVAPVGYLEVCRELDRALAELERVKRERDDVAMQLAAAARSLEEERDQALDELERVRAEQSRSANLALELLQVRRFEQEVFEATRERCAQVAEQHFAVQGLRQVALTARAIAAAIRALNPEGA